MVRNWITYYAFLMVSLAFALLVPGGVSSAFFYTLLVLPAVSLAMALWSLFTLHFEQSMERNTACKGDVVSYRLIARNRCPILPCGVAASFHGDVFPFNREFMPRNLAVPPFSAVELEIGLPCRYMGLYSVGLKQISIRDYLGLFTFRQVVAPLRELSIHPRILPVGFFPVITGGEGDALRPAGRSQENTANLSDIRNYTNGDRLRTIHWKLSAKKNELMVKNYEQTSGASACLIVDGSGSGVSLEESVVMDDRLAEVAVSLAWYFVGRSVPVEFFHSGIGKELHAINNSNDFHKVHGLLCGASLHQAAPLPRITGLQAGSANRKTVVIVCAALSDGLCSLALRCHSSGCLVVALHVAGCPTEENAVDEGVNRRMSALVAAGIAVLPLGLDEEIAAALSRRAV